LSVVKSPHEYYERLCALAAANLTSAEEDQRLAEHLRSCLVCKRATEDFTKIAAQLYREGEARAARELNEGETSEQVAAKQRLFGKVRGTIHLPLDEDRRTVLAEKGRSKRTLSLRPIPAWASLLLAAALVLAVGVDLVQYWRSEKHSVSRDMRSANLQREVEDLRSELASVQAMLRESASKGPSQSAEGDTGKLRADNETLRQELQATEAALKHEASEYAESQARIRLLQTSLDVLQTSNSTLEVEKSGLAEKVANVTADLRKAQNEMATLSARNDELSQESIAQVRSAERQQKLLATDHDIRDILGARSLHIIDVFDVSGQGEFERPFGRIFFTEGKSLIFYAFDLNQQKGLKRGAVFQAWGQKGEGKEDPRNLGAFYMDDPSQNRWVLRVDDSKALARIDYVFVTDSSHKGGVKPKGKPLLSAFLNGTTIHP
jgi:plasmid stabilization system protein ParE